LIRIIPIIRKRLKKQGSDKTKEEGKTKEKGKTKEERRGKREKRKRETNKRRGKREEGKKEEENKRRGKREKQKKREEGRGKKGRGKLTKEEGREKREKRKRAEQMKTALINSQSDTQGCIHQFHFFIGESAYIFWYDSTSIASAFSLSALRLINSISSASDIFFLPAETGKKRISARPAGTSGGTSMVSLWSAGISTVCVMLIRKI